MNLRDQFSEFDDALAAHGVPPLTAWWREGIGSWLDAYETGQVLELWACVGRGAAKSTALYKLALFFALFGDFVVPPGERHFAIVLSRLKEEAAKGIAIIDAWLTLLGVAHHLAGDVIELDEQPRGIRVVAASVAATSGWRAFFVAKDERGKWPLSGVDERDAEEIDTSAAAMTATHALAPIVTMGSAWLTLGAFHETIAAGSTSERVVLGPTPTWIAAPHITEADCRKKERDPRKFAREYASIASDAHDEALIDPHLVDRAMRAAPGDVPPESGTAYTAAMDPSLGRNAWTFVIAGSREVNGRLIASVVLHREWRASHGKMLDPAAVLATIAGHCAAYGVTSVRTDQFHGESLAAIAERMHLGIHVLVDKPTATERLTRYEGLLTRFLDNAIELPRDPVVRADLLAIRRRVSSGVNAFTISMAVTADGRHADYAPSCALALERIAVDDAIPGWVYAMERYAGDKAVDAGERPHEKPAIELVTRPYVLGGEEVCGFVEGKQVGRVTFHRERVTETWTRDVGSSEEFLAKVWGELKSQGVVT
ncbi:MAG TPA: hypothetical protein VGL81_09110 [Polyangiaceae bacterium]